VPAYSSVNTVLCCGVLFGLDSCCVGYGLHMRFASVAFRIGKEIVWTDTTAASYRTWVLLWVLASLGE
jgi:hypothetical protein